MGGRNSKHLPTALDLLDQKGESGHDPRHPNAGCGCPSTSLATELQHGRKLLVEAPCFLILPTPPSSSHLSFPPNLPFDLISPFPPPLASLLPLLLFPNPLLLTSHPITSMLSLFPPSLSLSLTSSAVTSTLAPPLASTWPRPPGRSRGPRTCGGRSGPASHVVT